MFATHTRMLDSCRFLAGTSNAMAPGARIHACPCPLREPDFSLTWRPRGHSDSSLLVCDSRPSHLFSTSACPVKTSVALAYDPARTERFGEKQES